MSSLPERSVNTPESLPALNSGPMPQIFVSYAHKDDDVLSGAKAGWVTTFLKNLETHLPCRLVRREGSEIWFDRRALSPIDPLTEQIVDAVRKADVLVVVLSPAYLASAWCATERNEFLRAAKERGRSRVVIVEKYRIEEADRPEEFRELTGFRFWMEKEEGNGTLPLGFPTPDAQNPAHANYYTKVDDLCEWLAKALQSQSAYPQNFLREPRRVVATPRSAGTSPTPVFLAPVGYDLETQWEGVLRYLRQAGVEVLPEAVHSYPLEPESFTTAAEKDLRRCGLFAQLLSEIPFREPPDSATEYAQLQVKLAQSLGKPILQWRHPRTMVSRVSDAALRNLLDAETVRSESIEDFKQEVRRRAFEKPPARSEGTMRAYVLVDATTKDAPLAHQISKALSDYGAPVVELAAPDTEGAAAATDPQDVRKELEENFRECDALIVVYGQSPSSWVMAQYKQWRKSQAERKRSANSLALVDGPPEKQFQVHLPGMQIVDCRKGLDEACLRQFLEQIRTEADQ